MKKYTFVNTAVFKGANIMPLYKVFDTETREHYWEVYAYGRERGRVSILETFSSPYRSEAVEWRKSAGTRR